MKTKQSVALVSTSVMAAGMAHGAIVYSGQLDQVLPAANGSYSFDLNQDGINDYRIFFDGLNGGNAVKPCVRNITTANYPATYVLSQANSGEPVVPFGTLISSSFQVGGNNLSATTNSPNNGYLYENYNQNVVGEWPSTGDTMGYVGLELVDTSGNTNYGWVRLEYNATNSSSTTVTVWDYAYETTPGSNIIAGAQQEPTYPVIYETSPSLTVLYGSTNQLSVVALGNPTPTYQWMAGAIGSATYTNLIDGGTYSGSTTPTLTITGASYNSQLDYVVVVSNSGGTATSPPITMTVVPGIVTGATPSSELIYTGLTANINIGLQTLLTATNQWRENGGNLSNGGQYGGVTTTHFMITNAGPSNMANYDDVVSTAFGSITSSVASFNVVYPDGSRYESNVLTTGPVDYYRLNELGYPSDGGLIAYDYVGGNNGIYGLDVANGAYSVVGPNPDAGFPGFEETNAAIQISADDATGNVVLSPWNFNTNTVTLTAWVNPQGNQVSGAAIVYTRGPNSAVGGLAYYGTQLSSGDYPLGYNWNNNSAAYSWSSGLSVPQNQWSFVALVITPTSATVYVMNTNGITSAVNAVANTNMAFNVSEYIGADPNGAAGSHNFAGMIDEVGVYAKSLTQNQLLSLYASGLGLSAIPPQITSEPLSTSVYANNTATFGVSAIGSAPISYQWQFQSGGTGAYVNVNNGSGISGATNLTLTVANVSGVNLGNYQLVITNSAGAVTSTPASLGLNAVFTKSPRLALKFAGDQNYSHNYINLNWTTAAKKQACGILGTTNWNNVIYTNGSPTLGYVTNNFVYDFNGTTNGNNSSTVLVDYHNGEQTISYNGTALGSWYTNNNCNLLDSAEKYPAGGQMALQMTNLDPVFATNGYSVYIYYLGGVSQGQNFYVNTYAGSTTNSAQIGQSECSLFTTTNWNSFNNGGYLTNLPAFLQGTAIFTQGAQSTNTASKGTPAWPGWENAGADYIVFPNLPPSGAFTVCVSNTSYGALCGIEIIASAPAGSLVVNGPYLASPNVYVGATVNLTCTTSGGSPPYSVQWQKSPDGTNFANISGANGDNLILSNVTTNGTGYYQMVYTANSVSATSSVQQVTVYASLPTISATTASPSNIVNQGSSVSLSCTTDGGAPPYSLQWMGSTDGISYTNIPGAISIPLTLPGVVPATSGYYDCVFTAGGLSVTSAPVQLTVQPLSISPAVALPSRAIFTGGSAILICSNYTGLGSFSFQWQQSSTPGGTYVNVPGATTNFMAIVGATTNNSGYYQCVLTAGNGSVASVPVQLGVLTPGGPVASLAIKFASNQDYGNCAITNKTMGAGLLNTTNWNNTDLGVGTGALLPFYDVGGVATASQAGMFEYQHGSYGFINTQNIAINTTNNNMALLNTCHAYGAPAPMFMITNLDPVFINGFYIIYYFAGNINTGHPGGQYQVNCYAGPTTNAPYIQQTQSQIWGLYGTNVLTNSLGSDWSAASVFVQGAYTTNTSYGAWETNWANYLIYSNLSGGSLFFSTPSGSYQGLSGLEIVANDNGTGRAVTISALSSSTNFAALGTMVTFTNVVSGTPPNGDYVIFMDGSTLLGYVAVSNGVATLSTSALAAGNHNITATYAGNVSSLQASTSTVLTYIVVSGTQAISAPVILPSPNVVVGTSVTLVCSNYTGTPMYGFLWQQSGDGVTYTNIGVTTTNLQGNTLPLGNVANYNSGYYRLKFTANGNTITSSVVQLTINPAPTISAAMASPGSTVLQGTVVTLNCTTNGGVAPYGLQWQASPNGVAYTNITGATSLPYSLGAVTTANAGYYQCIFTAGSQSVTSAPVQLTVNTAPPTLGIVSSGGSVTLTWNTGLLLQSTNIIGPWTTNVGATSPFTSTPTATNTFYRLYVP